MKTYMTSWAVDWTEPTAREDLELRGMIAIPRGF